TCKSNYFFGLPHIPHYGFAQIDQQKQRNSDSRTENKSVMKSISNPFFVFSCIILSDNRGNGCRKTYSDRHSNKHKTISERNGCEFGSSELSDHNIIDYRNKRMSHHSEDDGICESYV